MRYTAWGEVRYTWGSTPTDYTYTGQYSNVPEFGLMFYNARWYDPYITHFSQPDSIVPDPYNSQDWNRYAYGLNNPSRYTDPTGHMAVSDTNEAGCSGKGPKCIIDMYAAYGDDDGMMDSLRHYVRRHKDYNPVDDIELIDEEKAYVSVAMFQAAVQDMPSNASFLDIIKKIWPSAVSVAIFGIINDGWDNSHDDDGGGGGWSAGRGPKNAAEQAAMDKILADPWNGRQIIKNLGDSRWPPEEGWVKMETKINGQKYHWNLNKFTGAVEDIKPVP